MTRQLDDEGGATGRFCMNRPCDVVVVVVTYNSASDIDALIASLRPEALDLRLRLVVVDNSSTDDTLEIVSRHDDVVTVRAGGNLGYAGGINAAMRLAGPAEDVLILNPDLRVHRGAVLTMWRMLRSDAALGVVAPRILDDDGRTTPSLHNDPTVTRAVADAVLGRVWRSRPRALSESIRRRSAYLSPRDVHWASGAALLVRAEAARRVGEWDERFFLYSEEGDYCRRVRDAGFRVRYHPGAVVSHSQGGSGASSALDALLTVNRVRWMRKHAPGRAGAYRSAAWLGATLRSWRSDAQRTAAQYLARERLWERLPQGSWHPPAGTAVASVIIPAHDEEAVIARSLGHLSQPVGSGALEVRVVCNGCADGTAALARAVPGVHVVELTESSKITALNVGDAAATHWPRIYLDADIDLPSAAIPGLVRALQRDGVLGGRPPFEYDTLRSAPLVRAYYRARLRMPRMSEAMWGAGVYALNEQGHHRIGAFPAVTADDLYVDSRLTREEKAFPPTAPVRVRVPRTTAALVSVLTRVRRGSDAQGIDEGGRTLRALAGTVRGPVSLVDAVVYASLTVVARRRAAAPTTGWERDASTRPAIADARVRGEGFRR